MEEEDDRLYIKGPDFFRPVPDESLGEYVYRKLLHNNKQYEALVCAETGKKITYSEFLEKTCRLAQALERIGYKRGDVISISSENNLFFLQPVIAAMYLGITVAPINQSYSKGELIHTMNISQPKLIFCSNSTYAKFVNLKNLAPYLNKIIVFDLADNIIPDPNFPIEDFESFVEKYSDKYFNVFNFKPIRLNPAEDVAAILCSSGTTGMPKGVMLTHRNFVVKMEHKSDSRFYTKKENGSSLALMPFFHGFGFATSFENLMLGHRMVIMSRFKEELFLQSIEKYRITHLWIVPTIMVFLAKSPLVKNYDLSSVIELGCGAAPLSLETEQAVQKILYNLERFLQGYGLTEATFAVTVYPVGGGKRGSSGKILPGMVAKIRNPETNETLTRNKVGELCFKGPILMKGYQGNEEATKITIDKDGWLLSGDLGYVDDDGYFFIVDRLKELIKYKGFQVAPAELEKILLSHPKIKDAAIVGVPDEIAGELPMAFVIKQPGVVLTEEEVKIFVANQVSKPKQLHGGVRFVENLPKNSTGKILRRELKKMINGPPSHKL